MQQNPSSTRMLFTSWHPPLAAELFALVSGPEIGPACGWPPHTSVENSREIIENVLQGPTSYALLNRETEQLVGAIALRTTSAHFELGEHEAEIGYWIGKPFWGQGLASEAVRAILTHAFTQHGITRVWAAHHTDNPASGRVLEKCGFVFDRVMADVAIPLLGIRKDLRVLSVTPESASAV